MERTLGTRKQMACTRLPAELSRCVKILLGDHLQDEIQHHFERIWAVWLMLQVAACFAVFLISLSRPDMFMPEEKRRTMTVSPWSSLLLMKQKPLWWVTLSSHCSLILTSGSDAWKTSFFFRNINVWHYERFQISKSNLQASDQRCTV